MFERSNMQPLNAQSTCRYSNQTIHWYAAYRLDVCDGVDLESLPHRLASSPSYSHKVCSLSALYMY